MHYHKNIIDQQLQFYNVEELREKSCFLGPPDPLSNCSVINFKEMSMHVKCSTGFDGGLPATYWLEAFLSETGELVVNESSNQPNFILNDLNPGKDYILSLYASNDKGPAPKVTLEASTLKSAAKMTDTSKLLNDHYKNIMNLIRIKKFIFKQYTMSYSS